MDAHDTRSEALELAADGALTIPAAVQFSGCSRTILYEQMEAGMLAFLKVGRRRLIPKRALVEFLARRLNAAA